MYGVSTVSYFRFPRAECTAHKFSRKLSLLLTTANPTVRRWGSPKRVNMHRQSRTNGSNGSKFAIRGQTETHAHVHTHEIWKPIILLLECENRPKPYLNLFYKILMKMQQRCKNIMLRRQAWRRGLILPAKWSVYTDYINFSTSQDGKLPRRWWVQLHPNRLSPQCFV